MVDITAANVSWIILVLAGVGVSLLGVILGFFLGSRLKRERQDPSDTYRLRIETQKRLLDSAERANQGLKQAMEMLEWAAGTDRLTGAWNRRRFEEAANAEMALVRRRKGPVALMIFDLDFFKDVNDTHGHNVGDMVLAEIAHIAREQLRASDALARWGGEEFIVLSPATRIDGAIALAEKIREAVARRDFPGVGPVTISIGVAEFEPSEDLSSWIQRADEALYHAKQGGRNRVEKARSLEGTDPGTAQLLEIVWEDAFASGHPTIDSQHHRLFILTNSLVGAISSSQPQGEISMRLRRLMAHAAQHFHDEESLLTRCGYPGLPDHAAEHRRLLERAAQYEREMESGQADLSQFVGFLILDLVQGHILIEDRNYFPYLQKPSAPLI